MSATPTRRPARIRVSAAEVERAAVYDRPRLRVLDRPADRLLLALRTGRDAYRRDAQRPNVWHAYCPACSSRTIEQRTPTVTELSRGGAVTVRCRTGCTDVAIGDALAEAEAAFDASPPWWAAT